MFQTTASLPYLNFALWIIPQDRSFISHLLSLAASKPSLLNTITLENSSKAKLQLWQLLLANWNFISFFYDIQLYTDAAPSASFGGYYGRRWFTSAWPPEFCHYIQEWFLPSSAVFKIYPVVISALLWGHKWSKRSILIHSDNLTVAHIINKAKAIPLPSCPSCIGSCMAVSHPPALGSYAEAALTPVLHFQPQNARSKP